MVWFGLVLNPEVEADLVSWVRAGGPGVAGLPACARPLRHPGPRPVTPRAVAAVAGPVVE
uniref:hypothetical protein n=1 Tax=Paractinoplanes polyasparticus TaxID=2856853 RepID=UPI001C853B4B|nr:hypothetical protein [Actinoplanes polyasparticus]